MNKLKTYSSINVFSALMVLSILLAYLPISVLGECTCDAEEDDDINKKEALKLKIAGIISILVASAVGVSLPVLGKMIPALRPESNAFFVVKAFAGGVILATGFIHILPDVFGDLTSPCLNEDPWGNFPFTGFIAMVAAILTLMVDSLATGYFHRSNSNNKQTGNADEHAHAHHAHLQGSSAIEFANKSELIRHRVISQVLELGIVVHSVIIGIALGASQSPSTIRPLVGALTFHQMFEGMGLGGCIVQARFKKAAVVTMALFFSLTTPVGIGIGIGITNAYSETSPTALIVQGTLNAAAAGILIYMSLVDLLAADFMNSKMQSNGMLQFSAYVSLLLGAAAMSILAKWA